MTEIKIRFEDADRDQRWLMIDTVYQPGMSCGGIAKALGSHYGAKITRNVIVGMFNRQPEMKKKYGIEKQVAKPRHPRPPKAAPLMIVESEAKPSPRKDLVVPKSALAPAILPVRPPVAGEKNIPLTELRDSLCKWPTREDPDGHKFCGLQVLSKTSPYCESHKARATVGHVLKFNGKKAA